ncbi:hypothetical protein [Frigoriglobus tundricola]|uniref:Uncharacterized protein n=1 Tax=Frigoriglobus tundricola TaxID=2774151 RepID=A0A6M5YMQ3_9BACT|nr:hypothetical protein [Frigoriglobus tundricola]QJW95399.1 hypothetical protein FTUN_2948 [Frigoriglobus tundricola]
MWWIIAVFLVIGFLCTLPDIWGFIMLVWLARGGNRQERQKPAPGGESVDR